MLGFGSDQRKAKREGRRVEELYNATEIIDGAEMTPVLRGNCCMRGPVEETDLDNGKNMVTSQAERRFGKRSMNRRNRKRAESGTCNVCSAPCSSCMHLNLALMGSKTEEFSDETCRKNTVSQYSINEGDVLHSCNDRPCDSLQHTASEASNLLSVNSSYDSFSVNAESKATVKSSDISDASEDFEKHPKLFSCGRGAEDHLSPKPESVLDQRVFFNKYNDQKGVEGHDDNISRVCRANDANAAVSDYDRSVGVKKLSHNSASVCSSGSEGMGRAPSSQKLESLDIPSLKKVDTSGGFPKGGSPVSHSQGDKYLIEGSTVALTKVYLKSETETNQDSGELPGQVFQFSVLDKQDLKSTSLAEFPDVQPIQAATSDEIDESDVVEHDVKVCDICGDAGREDLLAICSTCSDGAEHTYCMGEMLKKIPEGDWLCEECKFAEEIEKQKQGIDIEGKKTNRISTSTESTGKRHAENLEAVPAAKWQAIETSLGSLKSSSPGRTATLSRDSSFKSLDKGKVRSASFGNHSSSDVAETARSPRSLLPQAPNGTLLKSSSLSTLNSKAKVKMVDEAVPQKHKGPREQASLDTKEGLSRVMGKSMSFKSTNSVRPSTGESKFRMLSPRPSHVHNLKGLKNGKEQNSFERRNLSRLDRPLPGSSVATVSMPKVDQKLPLRREAISLSSASNSRESKAVKTEGKESTLTKSNSNKARKGLEVPVTPVGALSTNGMCSSVEQKLNPVIPKVEPSSTSLWIAEKPSINFNEIVQDGLPRSMESTNQGEKPSSSQPRPTHTIGLKVVLCQKCKELGHDVESCPLGSPQVSGGDISVGRNSRGDTIKGNKLKAAIEAAMHKLPVAYGKNRVNDQSDGLCGTNMDLNCERVSQDELLISNKMKGTHEMQTNKQTTTNNWKPFGSHSTDLVSPTRVADSVSIVPSLGKAVTRDWPGHALAETSAVLKISAIPEHEYIWQGGFEVDRGAKLPDLCSGIQAHLSSCASRKVLEMVNKFPSRIQLNEIPRLSTWPTMFHEHGAKEDNIALYFFAKDHESYKGKYKCLVDIMIKNDLALKGNFEGFELLIFPSNQLPENCHRWNMLFFLWGVFRVRKVSCSNSLKNSCITGSNMVSVDGVISSDNMSLSQNLCLPKHTDKDSAASDSSHNIPTVSYGPDETCITINGNCNNKVSSVRQTSMGSQPNSDQQDGRLDSEFTLRAATSASPLSTEIRCVSPSLEERNLSDCGLDTEVNPSLQTIRISVSSSKGGMTEMNGGASPGEDSSSLKNLPVGNESVGDMGSSSLKNLLIANEGAGDVGSVNSEKVTDIRESGRHEINLEKDLNADGYMDTETALEGNMNLNHWHSDHQKYPHLDHTGISAENSSGTNRKMPWNEAFVDRESSRKKLNTGFAGAYECCNSRDRDSYIGGFSSQINDLGSSSSVEKRCNELSDKRDIPEDMGYTERYFFPLDSHVKDYRFGPNLSWNELSSKDENQFLEVVPNLELALGAETKQPNKGMLPFFVGPVEKNNNRKKPPDKEVEEDGSASLSLSLSFPFPDKEPQSMKPASKTEQLLPERHHVNTSLLLFGGFLDK